MCLARPGIRNQVWGLQGGGNLRRMGGEVRQLLDEILIAVRVFNASLATVVGSYSEWVEWQDMP